MIHPVILCGGSGTRLWPMSRGGYPKQYLKLTGDDTLVQQTALRLRNLPDVAAPIVVTNTEQRFLVAEQLRQVNISPSSIVLEPIGRNTAPAIAVAAQLALHEHPNALLLVLPSDHVISNESAFIAAAEEAASIASDGHLVTFGITPTEPQSGYGYIRRGRSIAQNQHVYKVDAFIEKPDSKTAERFLAEGGYYWNSGMFMLKAAVYLEELRHHAPEVAHHSELALMSATRDSDFVRLNADAFAAAPNISIDYAVMERTARAAVVEAADLGWNDIGSWSALADIADRDENNNTFIGDIYNDEVGPIRHFVGGAYHEV